MAEIREFKVLGVEEKQKLYLNPLSTPEPSAWVSCWRETKVVFKWDTFNSVYKNKYVEEKQKLYLNGKLFLLAISSIFVEEKQKLYLNV